MSKIFGMPKSLLEMLDNVYGNFFFNLYQLTERKHNWKIITENINFSKIFFETFVPTAKQNILRFSN